MKNKNLKLIISIVIIFGIVIVGKLILDRPSTNKEFTDTSLLGIWRGTYEENPGFEIFKDYLVEGGGKIEYKVDKSGNITISYPGDPFYGHYRIVGNKLYITNNQGGEDIYSKWCPDINDICK